MLRLEQNSSNSPENEFSALVRNQNFRASHQWNPVRGEKLDNTLRGLVLDDGGHLKPRDTVGDCAPPHSFV